MTRIRCEIKAGRILCVEVFPKDKIGPINEALSELAGLDGPKVAGGNAGPFEVRRYTWQAANLPTCLQNVIETSNGQKWGGKLDHLTAYVSKVEIEAFVGAFLPFYLVVLRATLNPTALSPSEDLRKDLRGVYNPLRLSLQSLGGLSCAGTSQSPTTPVVTYIAADIPQEDLSRLQNTANEIVVSRPVLTDALSRSESHRRMEPLELAREGGDLRSHFILASNVSLIVGHTYPLGMFGLGTPYLLLLSSGGGISEFAGGLPLEPYMPHDINDVILRGPEILVVPLALLAWTPGASQSLAGIEAKFVAARATLTKGLGDETASGVLEEVTEAGVRAASLAVDLGMIARRYTRVLQSWREGDFPERREVAILPTGWGGSSLLARGLRAGYVSTLAREVAERLENLEANLGRLQSEIELMSRHTAQAVSRRSTIAMEKATSQMQRLTRIIAWLTAALVVLGAITAAGLLLR
jgi:hypothetical protein